MHSADAARRRHVTECPVPVEERCCSVTIYRLIQAQPAIHEVRYNTATLELQVDYDPQQLPEVEFEVLSEDLTHHLKERAATCRDRDQRLLRRGCGTCLQQLLRRAREDGRNSRCDVRDCSALALMDDHNIEFRRGVLRVPRPGGGAQGRSSPWVTRKLRVGQADGRVAAAAIAGAEAPLSSSEQTAVPPAAAPLLRFAGWVHSAATSAALEPLFVAISLATLTGGAIAERVAAPLLAWAFYLGAYLFGGYFGVRAGLASLRARKIDIDLLMILAAVGAAAVGAPFEGALLLFLFSLSNVLQDFALDRTRSAIKALSKLRPDSAIVLDSPHSERGRRTAVDRITVGSLIQVRPGDRIALDGVVERGGSSVDQSSITGESMPVEKAAGQEVLAGSINQDGELVVRVTRTSSESTIARVITLVEEARGQQARTERFLERFEQRYAAGVIGATILAALLPPYLFGSDWSVSLYRAITLMVAASPCALIISTPASILSSIGNGARRGILFKGGVHVEQAAGIRAVAFDKTGTLTEGRPRVSDVISLSGESEDKLLSAAASLESRSEHVLAEAITAEARVRGLSYGTPNDFRSESGVGVRGSVNGRFLRLGSPAILTLLGDGNRQRAAAQAEITRLQRAAKTVVVLLRENNGPEAHEALGLIALEDRLRPGVREVIQDLRDAGIAHVAMLTGDNAVAAEQIAAQCGIDVVFPELLPENKLDAIRRMEQEYGPTAMVGDGVNDAPALAGARLGIAMGAAGTDVALETADIVLLSDDLEKIPYLIALSRRTRRTLITNIVVALGLIAMMIVGIYTVGLPLPLAVVGHEGGTVLVSLNGVRLLVFKRTGRRGARRAKRSGSIDSRGQVR
ncbi:MAG: heavy metal translocating P-type ATPase [Spirochaetaceae bacterium]|nr:MAG: heavy metal translocating P-type ATPase [Spirochaetaceae bacterium]